MSAEALGLLLRQLCLYRRMTALGRVLVQEAFLLLCASFTGTRPRILVPPTTATKGEEQQDGENEAKPSKRGRKGLHDFQSDVPRYVRYDDLPKTLCYGDVDLFVIRNPAGGSDVIVAVIDFRNLKGTEQGADG